MAKNKKKQKIVDLKSEATHITTDELTNIQKLVNEINQIKMELGNTDLRKHALLHSASTLQEEMNKVQKILNEKYGDVDIDVRDGSIKEKEDVKTDS